MKLNGILDFSMGNFLCLRGFASMRDLANISEPNPAIQRDLIEEHKGEMAEFLNRGEYLFFPEVVLSMILSDGINFRELDEFWQMVSSPEGMPPKKLGEFKVSVSNRETKKEDNQYSVERVKIASITFDEKIVRLNRIDGNHRLSAAGDVTKDLQIPYCILLFRTADESERYSRAIFHNINSKQIPLKLEENLKVIIESDKVFHDDKLENDPSFGLHYRLTRQLLREIDFKCYTSVNTYISDVRYTFFVDLFKYLLEKGAIQKDNAIETVKSQLVDIETSLRESQITATTTNIAVIGAMAFYKLTHPDKYKHFCVWLKKNNIGDVEMLKIDDVIKIFDKVYLGCPRKVFLSRWYPKKTDAEYDRAEYRKKIISEVVASLGLELIDIGYPETGSFDIRNDMYRSIEECDIFIADLTGDRPNVMVEVGYALKHITTKRMLIYYYPIKVGDRPPFDLDGYENISIADSLEIKQKVKPRIERILEMAKTGEL